MGNVMLCTGRYAGKPYFFESICVNVYCVEELCYLLAGNPFMINTDIMDKKLAEWLDKECGLIDLSHQLLTLFRRGSQPGIFANTILDYVNYCSREDKEKIEEVLQNNVGLSQVERQKKQGDFLGKNGKYQLALMEYDKLLLQLPKTELQLRPSIYHNMGTACCRLFQFENGARYFRKAYELSGNRQTGVCFLMAVRQQLSEGEYVSFIAENGQYYELSLEAEKLMEKARGEFEASQEKRMLSALRIYKEEGNAASYYEEIDKIISGLKNKYRESVAQ